MMLSRKIIVRKATLQITEKFLLIFSFSLINFNVYLYLCNLPSSWDFWLSKGVLSLNKWRSQSLVQKITYKFVSHVS